MVKKPLWVIARIFGKLGNKKDKVQNVPCLNLYYYVLLFWQRLRLDEVENQSQDDECKSNPLGSLCKLCVQRLSLTLGEESISAAGDSTGETGTLAALEKNDNSKSDAGKNLNNSKNDSK